MFLIFMVLVPILLLNMLIAMMGNTYAHVIEQSEKEWVKQVRKHIVDSNFVTCNTVPHIVVCNIDFCFLNIFLPI